MTLIKKTEVLSQLRDLGQQFVLPKGTTLAMEGDESKNFWWVINGKIMIYTINESGQQQELARFSDGEIVAAAIVFSEKPFPHHLIALNDCILLQFPKEPTMQRIIQTPALALFFITMLADKCRFLQKRQLDYQSYNLKHRLVNWLKLKIEQSGGDSVVYLSSKKDLASELNITPETLSRKLKELQDTGVLLVDKKKIILIDRSCVS